MDSLATSGQPSNSFFTMWDPSGEAGTFTADSVAKYIDPGPSDPKCTKYTGKLGNPYPVIGGDSTAVMQGLRNVIEQDRDAHWDPTAYGGRGGVVGSEDANGQPQDWRNSPRVIPIALFDPHQIPGLSPGSGFEFNNFVMLFLEPYTDPITGQTGVTGRFLYYFQGAGEGPANGPLVKTLQLVQ
jgi:hypothetical protein